jgi:hypothetical protein
MIRKSLNARLMQDAATSDEIYVLLLEITHTSLSAPIRLSTDNAERISTDPLVYGTRSAWRGANPANEPYLWVIASVLVPDDKQDAPAAGSFVLENLDNSIVGLLRSFTDLATLNMAVVLASSPDFIEREWVGLKITTAEMNAGEISLSFSREEIELERFPVGRLNRNSFPGLHL